MTWSPRERFFPRTNLLNFIRCKTGALFEASLLSAAELCDVNAKDKHSLSMYSKNMGLAFQINDDVLDVVGDENKLGKTIGSDCSNEKSTFIKLMGIEAGILKQSD